MKNLKDEFDNLREQQTNISENIEEFSETIDSFMEDFTIIETPLGTVTYKVTGSLKLVEFMESIEEQIRAL